MKYLCFPARLLGRRTAALLLLLAASTNAQPAPTAAPAECVPPCRAGYVCVQGACVSACNPPCAAGELCTSDGNCVASQPPPAPPPPAPPPPQQQAAPPPPPASYPPPPTQGEYEPPPPPPESRKKARFHEGFYFRFGLGFGPISGTAVDIEDSTEPDIDISGFSTMGELAFGGTPSPGLAIGGGIFGTNTPTVTYEQAGTEYEGGAAGISNIAFFIDFYPMPDQGFHFGGGAGVALISATEGTEGIPDDYFGAGFGFHAAIGYEGWVGKEWGIGVQGRLLYANGTISSFSGVYDDLDVEAFVPGVMFTATCH